MIMNTSQNSTVNIPVSQHGFTLVEIMIVVAIIGVLAAIAYPSYQRYVIKTKRVDMMTEMQNIASEIESRKLAQGRYSNALVTGLGGDYPNQGTALYTVTIGNVTGVSGTELTSKWQITASPKSGQMVNDGTLTLNYQGIKCRDTACGTGEQWNQ